MSDKQGIHLVMPMGGTGARFAQRGFLLPKPLLKIQGRPFFYWAAQSVAKFVKLQSLTFAVLREHVTRFRIDEEILKYYPFANIRVLDQTLNGAVLTCLEGVQDIAGTAPVVFNDCDHIFRCGEFEEYCARGDFSRPDGALLTFASRDPNYSFAQLDKEGNVVRTTEKEVTGDRAICGAYYFRNRPVFEEAAREYLRQCVYKEFFLSGVYNVLAARGAAISCLHVDMHLEFGTPEEYDAARNSDAFSALL